MVDTLGSTLVRSSIIFSKSSSSPPSMLYTESSMRAATLLYVSWTQSTSASDFALMWPEHFVVPHSKRQVSVSTDYFQLKTIIKVKPLEPQTDNGHGCVTCP